MLFFTLSSALISSAWSEYVDCFFIFRILLSSHTLFSLSFHMLIVTFFAIECLDASAESHT